MIMIIAVSLGAQTFVFRLSPSPPARTGVGMAQDNVVVLPQVPPADIQLVPATSLDVERLSNVNNACSDSSSGTVPTISADAVNTFTVVPVTSLNSVSSSS